MKKRIKWKYYIVYTHHNVTAVRFLQLILFFSHNFADTCGNAIFCWFALTVLNNKFCLFESFHFFCVTFGVCAIVKVYLVFTVSGYIFVFGLSNKRKQVTRSLKTHYSRIPLKVKCHSTYAVNEIHINLSFNTSSLYSMVAFFGYPMYKMQSQKVFSQ